MAEAAAREDGAVQRIAERPGLTMVKRVIRKEDGRWLIYFDFEREGQPAPADGGTAQ